MIRISPQRIVRGETHRLRLTVRDQDRQPVDLTGATLHAQVRPVVEGYLVSYRPPVIQLSSPSAGITLAAQTGNTLGQATATFSATETALLAAGEYAWDAWVVTAGGDRHAVVAPSRLTVIDRVTALA